MKLFIFLLSTACFANSQNQVTSKMEVSYNIFYNTELKNTQEGVLHIDESLQKAVFVHGKKTEKSISEDEDDDAKFNIQLARIKKFNYTNFKSDSLFSKNKVFKEFIVEEKIPQFKWELKNETKELNDLLLRKATLNFRGRNFIAWYCEEYPVKFGPWKFSGLPGLIVDIYDETRRYQWTVSSIKVNDSVRQVNFDELSLGVERIDIKEYVERRYNNNGLVNQSKLPRGYKIVRTKLKRNSIELKFEWEEKTQKN